jgi:hypothetical protein
MCLEKAEEIGHSQVYGCMSIGGYQRLGAACYLHVRRLSSQLQSTVPYQTMIQEEI